MVNINSKKQYLQTYLSLVKKSNSEKIDDIYKYIVKADVKDATKASYLNSIISLKKLDQSLVKGDLKDIIDLRDQLTVKIEKDRNEDNLNEKQKNAIEKIKLDDLEKFVNELKLKRLNSNKDLEDYILIYLMVNYPLRNDLQEIHLTFHKSDLKQPLNVLYIPKKGKSILSLKEYKTSKTNGSIIINLDEDITNDIKLLIKNNINRKFLFCNLNNEALSSSSFTHKLNRIFKKKFDIPISSTILRKIYLTGKYGDVMEEFHKDNKLMGHSSQVAQKIYISNNKKDI